MYQSAIVTRPLREFSKTDLLPYFLPISQTTKLCIEVITWLVTVIVTKLETPGFTSKVIYSATDGSLCSRR